MNAIKRINIIIKSAKIFQLLIMGLIYGLLFGGIGQIFVYTSGKISLTVFIVNVLFYIFGYECIFLFVILIIISALNVKVYLSLGMERRDVFKIWRDAFLYITGFIAAFMVVSFYYVLNYVSNAASTLESRALNMDFNSLTTFNNVVIIVLIILVVLFLNSSVSMLVGIGNKFGIIICFASVGVILGIIALLIPSIINLIQWGDNLYIFIIGLIAANLLMFYANKKMIITMEVVR